MNAPNIHAIVVAYFGAEQLSDCLRALAEEIPITVVDNSNSLDVRAVAIAHKAHYLASGANLGFAAGVNGGLTALAAYPPRDVLLLNPDASLEPSALRKLARSLHAPGNDRLAAVAPRLYTPTGREQRVTWPFPSPKRAWVEALGLGGLAVQETFLIGAVLLVRWEAIQDVGMFDERFFLYAEEADWQQRAVRRGWVTRLCTDVTAVHAGAGASDDPTRREILFHAAQETYIRKWYGRRGWFVYRFAACSGAAGRAVLLDGDRRSEAARRARLYARGPIHCATLIGQ